MKKLLLLSLSILFVQALSAKVYDSVSLTLDKADGVYSIGQTAVVSASTENPGEELRLVVKDNGNTIIDSTIVLTADPTPVFSQLCDKTKWILVKIGPKESKDFSSVGYVVDPQNFTTALQAPSDLYEYWDEQLATMRSGKKMKITKEPVEIPEKYAGKVKCWHVTISMPEGRPVNGYLAVPVDAAKKTLPILLTTHGASAIDSKGTRSNLGGAAAEASKGCIAMDINAHGMEDSADAEYYKALKEELKNYQRQPLSDRESYYFRLMYLRCVRAIDFLVKLPEWDGQKIMVSGSSQGGAQSLAAGGIDPRVTHVRASVPAITNVCGWFEGYQGGWPYNSKKVANKLDKGLANSILPYFDTALLISRFKGKLFIELGFIDETCSPNATYSAYNNAVNVSSKSLFTNIYRPHGQVAGKNKKSWAKARKSVINPFNDTFYYKQQ